MTMRALAFVVAAIALGGCVQDNGTLDPVNDANWKQRDKDLMSNLPYNQSAVGEAYRRHFVEYQRKEAPGTILIDSDNKFLYYVLPQGKAVRYGIAVGEEAQAWSGLGQGRPHGRMAGVAPDTQRTATAWTACPEYVTGGPHNPMGARGMYLYSSNRDTLYRIHGTNQPEYIGSAVSSGCIRMTNEDVIDLYNRVKVGTPVIVLGPHQSPFGVARMAGIDAVQLLTGYPALSSEYDLHDFGRHAEPRRNKARAKPSRHDQVPSIFDHVSVRITRAVFRRHEGRPNQR